MELNEENGLRRNSSSIIYGLIVVLLSIAIQVPLYNRGLIFFDEGVAFNFAEYIMKGSVIYAEKPIYVFPGLFYFLALLYKIFGISVLVSRYAMAVAFSATALMVFLMSRHLIEEWLAFLVALIFVGHRLWAYPVWNYMGYATFSMFFLSVALLLLFAFSDNPRPRTALFVGLFVGLATMFKQDYGVFVGFGMFLFIFSWPYLQPRDAEKPGATFPRANSIIAYIVGGLVVCLPIFGHLALNGALDDMVHQTFLLPLSVETTRETTPLIPLLPLFGKDPYVRDNWLQYAPAVTFMRLLLNFQNGLPAGFLYMETPVWELLLKLIHYMPYLASLLVAAILAKHYVKGAHSTKHQKAVALLSFGVLILLTQHRPFDFAHLMQMYLPVFLLAGFLVGALYQRIHPMKKLLYPVFGGLAVLLGLYLYYTIACLSFLVELHPARLEVPRANIYLPQGDRDACAEAIRFITENTSPDEPILVLPYHGLFYFLAQRPNPTPYQNVWPVKVFKDMDREIVDALERERVRYIVEFPQELEGIGLYQEFAPEIAHYVKNKYAIEKSIGDREMGLHIVIMKRKNLLQ